MKANSAQQKLAAEEVLKLFSVEKKSVQEEKSDIALISKTRLIPSINITVPNSQTYKKDRLQS